MQERRRIAPFSAAYSEIDPGAGAVKHAMATGSRVANGEAANENHA